MSEHERSEIIRIHQERRMHAERRRAAEAEMRAREAAEHRSHYPQLIHLHLSGGVFIYRGTRYHYHAHNLSLRDGERRRIELVSTHGTPPHRITLWMGYKGGKVVMGDGRRTLRSFAYRDSWRDGEHHRGIKLRGAVRMEGVDIVIGSKPYQAERQHEPGRDNSKGGGLMRPFWGKAAAEEKARQERARKEQQQGERLEQRRSKQNQQQQERVEQERVRQEQQRERLEQRRSKQHQQQQEQAERERARQEQQRERLELRRSKQNQQQQERAEQERVRQEQQSERAEQQRSRQEQRQQEKEERERARQEKHQAREEPPQQDEAKQAETWQERASQARAKGRDGECVERGSKNNKGLPYCDE